MLHTLRCPPLLKGIESAGAHCVLLLQGHPGADVAMEKGQAVGHNDPLHGPLPGLVDDQFGQTQEQAHEGILWPARSPLHEVPKDQEHGADVQPKTQKEVFKITEKGAQVPTSNIYVVHGLHSVAKQ
eukprot:g39566.t1